MGKSWFSDENGAEKKNFQKCQKKFWVGGLKVGRYSRGTANKQFFILSLNHQFNGWKFYSMATHQQRCIWKHNLQDHKTKFEPPHDKTNDMTCALSKDSDQCGICPVWSESLLCAQFAAKGPSFLHADSEDSDQTGQMTRLMWAFTGCTGHIVGFVMQQLNSLLVLQKRLARKLSLGRLYNLEVVLIWSLRLMVRIVFSLKCLT